MNLISISLIIFILFMIAISIVIASSKKKSTGKETYVDTDPEYSNQFTSSGCNLTPVSVDSNVYMQSYRNQPCVGKDMKYCDKWMEDERLKTREFDGVGIHLGYLISFDPSDQFVMYPFGYNPKNKKYYVFIKENKVEYLQENVLSNNQLINYPKLHKGTLQVQYKQAYQYDFNGQNPPIT